MLGLSEQGVLKGMQMREMGAVCRGSDGAEAFEPKQTEVLFSALPVTGSVTPVKSLSLSLQIFSCEMRVTLGIDLRVRGEEEVLTGPSTDPPSRLLTASSFVLGAPRTLCVARPSQSLGILQSSLVSPGMC